MPAEAGLQGQIGIRSTGLGIAALAVLVLTAARRLSSPRPDDARTYADAPVIGEVYGELAALVRGKACELDTLPKPDLDLDFGLGPERLMAGVRLCRERAVDRIREIVQLFEPRLVVPGEQVLREGDAGRGVLRLERRPPRADLPLAGAVRSRGVLRRVRADHLSADLLVLRTADFRRLMDASS